MNFNIHVEDALGSQLDQLAQQQGKKRNTVIREALENWVQQQTLTTWPNIVMSYQGEREAIAFETSRDELTPPIEIEF